MDEMSIENKPILLVEDDEIDIMTVKRAVKTLKVLSPLHLAANGEEALEYLEENVSNLPGIILLDINMPRMNGIEFLNIIKKDERFLRIPVIVLTTSKEHQDRYESFNLNAAGYMIKPVMFDEFVNVIELIHKYWSISKQPD
jgi:CheY-like chemotaxis protein